MQRRVISANPRCVLCHFRPGPDIPGHLSHLNKIDPCGHIICNSCSSRIFSFNCPHCSTRINSVTKLDSHCGPRAPADLSLGAPLSCDSEISSLSEGMLIGKNWRESVCSINSVSDAEELHEAGVKSMSSENECLLPKKKQSPAPLQTWFENGVDGQVLLSNYAGSELACHENRSRRAKRAPKSAFSRECRGGQSTRGRGGQDERRFAEMSLKIGECQLQMAKMTFKMEQMEKDLARLTAERDKEARKTDLSYGGYLPKLADSNSFFQKKSVSGGHQKKMNFFDSLDANFGVKKPKRFSFFKEKADLWVKSPFAAEPPIAKNKPIHNFFDAPKSKSLLGRVGEFKTRPKGPAVNFFDFGEHRRPAKNYTSKFFSFDPFTEASDTLLGGNRLVTRPRQGQASNNGANGSTLQRILENQKSMQKKINDMETANGNAYKEMIKSLVVIREFVEKRTQAETPRARPVFHRRRGQFRFDFSHVNPKQAGEDSAADRLGSASNDVPSVEKKCNWMNDRLNESNEPGSELKAASTRVVRDETEDSQALVNSTFDEAKSEAPREAKLGERAWYDKLFKAEATRGDHSEGREKGPELSDTAQKMTPSLDQPCEELIWIQNCKSEFEDSEKDAKDLREPSAPLESNGPFRRPKASALSEAESGEEQLVSANSFGDDEQRIEKIGFSGRNLDARLTTCFPFGEKMEQMDKIFWGDRKPDSKGVGQSSSKIRETILTRSQPKTIKCTEPELKFETDLPPTLIEKLDSGIFRFKSNEFDREISKTKQGRTRG